LGGLESPDDFIGSIISTSGKARALAEHKGVEIRTYQVIYDIMDDLRKAAEGLLAPEPPAAEGVPYDLTREPMRFPAGRDQRLQACTLSACGGPQSDFLLGDRVRSHSTRQLTKKTRRLSFTKSPLNDSSTGRESFSALTSVWAFLNIITPQS
jgi:hypothetical protein